MTFKKLYSKKGDSIETRDANPGKASKLIGFLADVAFWFLMGTGIAFAQDKLEREYQKSLQNSTQYQKCYPLKDYFDSQGKQKNTPKKNIEKKLQETPKIEIENPQSNNTFDQYINAIIQIESSGNPNAYNREEAAAGLFQIRPIYVEDVNRILGEERFTLEDRWNKDKSTEMFKVYTSHYYNHYKKEIEKLGMQQEKAQSRIHNGGPKGWKKESTETYWNKINHVLKN